MVRSDSRLPEYLGELGLFIDWLNSVEKDKKASGYFRAIEKQLPQLAVEDLRQLFLVAWDPELFTMPMPFYCSEKVLQCMSKTPDVALGFLTYLRRLKTTTNVTLMVRLLLRHFFPYDDITEGELVDEVCLHFPNARREAMPSAIKKAKQRLANKAGPTAPTRNHTKGHELLLKYNESLADKAKEFAAIRSSGGLRGQIRKECP